MPSFFIRSAKRPEREDVLTGNPSPRSMTRAEQRFRVDPNLLGSLQEGEAFVISQRRAQLVRVARQLPSDAQLGRAAHVLRPKALVEGLETSVVTPPGQTGPSRAVEF